MKKINSIAVCADGNRRWAVKNRKQKVDGHACGAKNILNFIDWAKEEKIQFVTFYIFSTENWNRTKFEIKILMDLFCNIFEKRWKEIEEKNVEINFIGEREKIPKKIKLILEKIEKENKKRKNEKRMKAFFALSYGGRLEIVEAIKKIPKKEINELTEKKFENFLWSNEIPDPEIVIRTGGHKRLSNFLLWKSAYSELFFINKLWPEFSKKRF